MTTVSRYRSLENIYDDFDILYGPPHRQDDPDFEKIYHIGSTLPRLISLRNNRQIMNPLGIQEYGDESYEFCVEYDEFGVIQRISRRKYDSPVTPLVRDFSSLSQALLDTQPRYTFSSSGK